MYGLIYRDTKKPVHTRRIYSTLGAAKSARTNMFGGGYPLSRALRRVNAEDRAQIVRVETRPVNG